MTESGAYRPNKTDTEQDAEEPTCEGSKCECRPYNLHGYGEQLKEVLKLAWPIVMEQLVFTLTAMFTGHLGKNLLDGMALGNTAVTVTGFSLAIGVNTACDTLFSQTHGSKNRKYLGILLQKALVINVFLCMPCAALLLNMDYIMMLTGQDPVIARIAGLFSALNIPGIMLSTIMMLLYKYLACQNIVRPTLVIMTVMNVLHLFFLQLFLYWFKLEIVGAAIAINLTYFSGVVMHVMYIYGFRVYKNTWTGWSWMCLMEWKEFVHLAVFGLLMTCLSWWSVEIYMVLMGLLGKVALGAHYVAFQISNTLDMAAFGFAIAVNVRVGNLIGNGDHVTARIAARVGIVAACAISLTSSISFLLCGHFLPWIFTNDSDVTLSVTRLVPFMSLYLFSDFMRAVTGSVLRGIGRQRFGAVVSFITVYFITMPLGIYLMFATSLGIFGTWIGICMQEIIRSVVFFVKVQRLDWIEEARLAEIRTRTHDKKIQAEYFKEYQPLSQEDSSDNDSEEGGDVSSKEGSDGHHVSHTLRRTIIIRGLTFGGLLLVLILGISLHILNNYTDSVAPASNVTIAFGE